MLIKQCRAFAAWSVLRSIGFITRSLEEVVAFFLLEEVADASDGLPELVVCSGSGLSE